MTKHEQLLLAREAVQRYLDDPMHPERATPELSRLLDEMFRLQDELIIEQNRRG